MPDVGSKKSFLKKEYLLIIILTALVVVIFLSGQDLNFNLIDKGESGDDSYVTNLQNSLKNVLSDVDGAGKINVLITVDGSEEEVVLKNVETAVDNGVKTTVESIVLVGGKPYVIKVNNPKVLGVVVVCEGADVVDVKLKIIEIVTTTLKVDADSVRIIKMK
ncbi:MAG: hypothetical protein J6Q38_03585 [Clostridia bacterium]|nr:hypothetical protein [Clostridia bacterium]